MRSNSSWEKAIHTAPHPILNQTPMLRSLAHIRHLRNRYTRNLVHIRRHNMRSPARIHRSNRMVNRCLIRLHNRIMYAPLCVGTAMYGLSVRFIAA